MNLYIDGIEMPVDLSKLREDLSKDQIELVTISAAGELVIDDLCHGLQYKYRREVWQLRLPGVGVNNQEWGGLEWEFCRTIYLAD